MPIVRRSRADIDKAQLTATLAARRPPSESQIERQAAEDGDAWSDADLAEAQAVYPPPSPEDEPGSDPDKRPGKMVDRFRAQR